MKYNEYEPTVWAIKPGLLAFFIHNNGIYTAETGFESVYNYFAKN